MRRHITLAFTSGLVLSTTPEAAHFLYLLTGLYFPCRSFSREEETRTSWHESSP